MLNSQSLNEELLSAFVRLIAKHSGIEIREREQAALSEKILLRMKSIKLDSPENYYKLLNSSTPNSHKEWKSLMILITNI